MSVQFVIDNATFLNINKRKVTAQSVSRSGHLKTAERSPAVYQFTVGSPAGLKYSENRGTLQTLDDIDRITESNVDIGANNTGISYLTTYLGDLNPTQQSDLTLNSVSGANIYIDQTGITGNTSGYSYIFKKGDYIQPLGNASVYRYPYQVTSDVAFNIADSNTTVPVHRPVLSQTDTALNTGGFRIGSNVRFHVKCFVNPTYTVVPHDLVQFDEDFVLMEVIT
jgi:hypothetical protein